MIDQAIELILALTVFVIAMGLMGSFVCCLIFILMMLYELVHWFVEKQLQRHQEKFEEFKTWLDTYREQFEKSKKRCDDS